MITLRKQSLIKLCIKLIGLHDPIKVSLIQKFNLIKNNFSSLEEEDLRKIRENFSVERYIEKLIPIFDSYFSEEELKEINKFYSSKIGLKLLEPNFLIKIKNIGDYFSNEIEKTFIIEDTKKNKK